MISTLFPRLPKHSIFHVVVFTKFSLLDLNLLSVLNVESHRSEMFHIGAPYKKEVELLPGSLPSLSE